MTIATIKVKGTDNIAMSYTILLDEKICKSYVLLDRNIEHESFNRFATNLHTDNSIIAANSAAKYICNMHKGVKLEVLVWVILNHMEETETLSLVTNELFLEDVMK